MAPFICRPRAITCGVVDAEIARDCLLPKPPSHRSDDGWHQLATVKVASAIPSLSACTEMLANPFWNAPRSNEVRFTGMFGSVLTFRRTDSPCRTVCMDLPTASTAGTPGPGCAVCQTRRAYSSSRSWMAPFIFQWMAPFISSLDSAPSNAAESRNPGVQIPIRESHCRLLRYP